MKLIPIAFISLLFAVLGVRMLRSAANGGGSERWLALFFLSAALAMPLRVASTQAALYSWEALAQINGLAHVGLSVGISAFSMFVWRVFRRHEVWARVLCFAFIGTQVFSAIAIFSFSGHRLEGSSTVLVVNSVRALPFLWAFIESVRYSRLMRRRVELGLAEPVVTQRFRLFAIWTGALFVLPVVMVILRIRVRLMRLEGALESLDPPAWAISVVSLTVLTTGLIAFAALWLSFFPPRAYLARLDARRHAA